MPIRSPSGRRMSPVADSGAPRHRPSVLDVQPGDLSTAGSCATALARRHRTGSLGRVGAPAATACRLDFTIHVPGPGGPRHCPARQRPVACTRPPGSGTPSAAQSHAANQVMSVIIPATMGGMEEVEVVVAHSERATLRVGDVFLKIDADQARAGAEVEAMALAPIPTPEILWRK